MELKAHLCLTRAEDLKASRWMPNSGNETEQLQQTRSGFLKDG
jgi:hypothetical protein